MVIDSLNLVYSHLSKDESVPYNLLLLADPSPALVDAYLPFSDVVVAMHQGEYVGVIVITPLDSLSVEIKNIAVEEQHQGKGIGKCLLYYAVDFTRQKGYKSIYIGTANSSINQLGLYQKVGFDIVEIDKDFFIKNYAEPIYENGIQAKHMIRLVKNLD